MDAREASRRRVNRPLVEWRINELKLTNARVAAFLGVSAGQFSRLKSGERNLRDDQAEALALVLGIPVELVAPLPASMAGAA